MIEAKYFKDYRHNYLILKSSNGRKGENYQYHMLASNKIERILNCSVRNVNGEVYFYYDISSKVTLENYYQARQMNYEQIQDFFVQMDGIYQRIGEFFMEESGLLMYPDSIYYDFASGKYYGLYYPGEQEEMENSYEQLMDFLINHIDTGNQRLVDVIYQIYEMSGEQFFSWSQALQLFEDTSKDAPEAVSGTGIMGADITIEASCKTFGAPGVYDGVPESRMQSEIESVEEYENTLSHRADESTRSIKNRNGISFYHVFAALSLCGIVGTLWIYMNYELAPKEMMITVCCAGVMALCFLFSLIQVLLSGRKNREKEIEEQAQLREIEDEFREERAPSLQNVLDRNMDMTVVGGFAARQAQLSRARQVQTSDMCQTSNFGETVFIDTRKQSIEYKLYALDKKNKKHIELTRFPFTIGKMAGCVDCVLSDDSISRLHARIEKQDEKILLTDMNSMNGTYKNGLRMEPSETVEIEPGDEIRFGKLNYCYR